MDRFETVFDEQAAADHDPRLAFHPHTQRARLATHANERLVEWRRGDETRPTSSRDYCGADPIQPALDCAVALVRKRIEEKPDLLAGCEPWQAGFP